MPQRQSTPIARWRAAPIPADGKTQREQAVDLVFAGPEADWIPSAGR
jgi:hypothetical protein